MVMTSPPYWGLRDYSTEPQVWGGDKDCKHEWGEETKHKTNLQAGNPEFKRPWREKASCESGTSFCIHCNAWKGEFGLEPTPELYIEHLCDIFDSLPIKKTGSLWVNIADSYDDDRSLAGIPEMFVLEMKRRGWIRRNTIIWHKPSCMPSSAKNRLTVDFEYLYFFTKQGKYYFEQQLEPNSESTNWRFMDGQALRKRNCNKAKAAGDDVNVGIDDVDSSLNPEGRNKRCVWSINPQPSSIEHFAMYPEKLCVTPIKAGCPESGIVLDPFMGSGTTAVVAHKLGRNWIGVELNPKSIKDAEDRIKEEMRQERLF